MKRQRGFTLVELLVVIGIIALLIGILLPVLGKARQSANRAACLSNLHNLGIALLMYANNNQGSLPFGTNNVTYSTGTVPVTWGGLLSVQMGMATEPTPAALGDSSTNKGRGIFVCKDAFIPQSTATMQYVQNTYTVHPNLMPEMVSATAGTPLLWPDLPAFAAQRNQQRRPYKLQALPNPSQLACMWDGAQQIPNGNAYAVGFALDNKQLGGMGNPLTYNNTMYANNNGKDLGVSVDGGANQDSLDGNTTDLVYGNIRWRHMGNKGANFLFVDGHADGLSYTSRYKTGLLRRNICVPPPK